MFYWIQLVRGGVPEGPIQCESERAATAIASERVNEHRQIEAVNILFGPDADKLTRRSKVTRLGLEAVEIKEMP